MTEAPRITRRTDEERAADQGERTELFWIDDVCYSIPNRVRPSLSYGYLRRLAKDGEDVAEAWLLNNMLGDDVLAALESLGDDLTDEMNEQVMERVRLVALGGAKAPKGH